MLGMRLTTAVFITNINSLIHCCIRPEVVPRALRDNSLMSFLVSPQSKTQNLRLHLYFSHTRLADVSKYRQAFKFAHVSFKVAQYH